MLSRSSRRAVVGLLVLVLALALQSAGARSDTMRVTAYGRAILTYDQCAFGLPGCSPHDTAPAEFAITSWVARDGSAIGTVAFELANPFVNDSFYGTPQYGLATTTRLAGTVNKATVGADGGLTLSGTLDERDYDAQGVQQFSACNQAGCNEPAQPFTVVVGGSLGRHQLTLNWCELPGPFTLRVTEGHIEISGVPAAPAGLHAALASAAATGCSRGY